MEIAEIIRAVTLGRTPVVIRKALFITLRLGLLPVETIWSGSGGIMKKEPIHQTDN